jgi:AcrR family transcriptional regulator
MSIGGIAQHLRIPKSTVYSYFKKFQIPTRTKSQAQNRHVVQNGHQRKGLKHSDESKEKISNARKEFWDSDRGLEQKKQLGKIRAREWEEADKQERARIVSRLRDAPRPKPGELSRFGKVFADFLAKRERLETGISLTQYHVSDIILVDRRVVIELLIPISVYGEEQEQRLSNRYERLVAGLNNAGYRVVIIEDKSNSVSIARCNRAYQKLLEFFKSEDLNLKIVS